MNSLTYSCSVLKRKLGDIAFQVWGHNDYTNVTTFLGGEEHLEKAPPFLDYSLNRPTFKVRKMNDKVIIYLLYSDGHQIAICIFNKEILLTDEDIEDLFHMMRIFGLEKTIHT